VVYLVILVTKKKVPVVRKQKEMRIGKKKNQWQNVMTRIASGEIKAVTR